MTLAIVGSRTFENYNLLYETIEKYKNDITKIISGGADGADSLAIDYAKEVGIEYEYEKYLPNWKIYGKSAGMIRNKRIVDDCDKLVAFWNGFSKGTLHTLSLASKQKKVLEIVYF